VKPHFTAIMAEHANCGIDYIIISHKHAIIAASKSIEDTANDVMVTS
jgi:hypothetical protein